jgi:hypothetical protein
VSHLIWDALIYSRPKGKEERRAEQRKAGEEYKGNQRRETKSKRK